MSPFALASTRIVRPLYEFIFPQSCFACDGPLQRSEHKVCRSCWEAMPRVSHDDILVRRTSARLKEESGVAGLRTLFLFAKDGPLQTLIHHLKYNGITDLGVELGKQLGGSIQPMISQRSIAGMIPVPLHDAKIRERGYNQSEYVCCGISAVTGLAALSGVLERARYTESQTHLDIEERRRNVAGAFVLRPSVSVRGLTYLLVDDVITTGATMSACAKVLVDNGAAGVVVCSVAIAE